jgi:K+-sensing histidine kinase KdpD
MGDWDMDPQRFLRAHRSATVVAAAAAPLVVASVLALFRDSLTPATDVLVLVAVVVVFCTTGIRTAGLAAVLSAAVWFDFFLTEPYQSFAIKDPNDVEAAVLLLVIGGIVTETALWGQRNAAALSRQVGYVDGVLATAESVAVNAHTAAEVAVMISRRISEVLNLDQCAFEPGGGASDPLAPTLHHDGSVTRGGRNVDVDRDGLPVDSVVILPVRAGGEVRGRFILTAASHVARPNVQQRRVAVLLADQMASALNGTTRS